VIIGGDGSLTGAETLRQEWSSLLSELVSLGRISQALADEHPFLSIAGMVGSIDNDMVGTELTIGANSSLHRIIEAVDAITTSALSHQRTFIIEVMGRHCGWLAVMASIASGADWLLIPEVPSVAEEWKDSVCASIQKANPPRHLFYIQILNIVFL
jgi:6-phosphofructokinase 1